MKHIKIFIAVWLVLFTLLIAFSSFAQTDNYSCNVICLNQPDHVMEGVQVDLYDSNGQFVANTMTDTQGYFYFDNLLVGESYTAKFEYDAENTYVDLEDAFAILFYVLGFTEFNEYQEIAANVDGNNHVNFQDFLIVLIDYYIMQQPFPVGDWILPDWEFTIDANKATGGPAGGFSSGNINDDDGTDKNIYQAIAEYDNEMAIEDLNVFEVPVYLKQYNEISGIALIAHFNDELYDVIDIKSPIEDINYSVIDHEIRIAWTDASEFENKSDLAIANIYLKQKHYTSYEKTERLEILNESHVLDTKGHKIPFIEFSSNEFKTASLQNNQSLIYPNPCEDFFYIQIEDNFESAEYILYNALGQIVDQRIINSSEQIKISTAEMQKGIYYYHINYQSKSITGPLSIR